MLRLLGLCALCSVTACHHDSVFDNPPYYEPIDQSMGKGGYNGKLSFPFRSGEYYNFTRGFNTATHQDYGGSTSDDRFAMDFAQSGCKVYGDDVTPVQDGVIRVVKPESDSNGYGNTVLVDHSNGLVSRYAHLSQVYVSQGDQVDTNTAIGAVGNTGNVSGTSCKEHPGAHLHLALYLNGEGIKPSPMGGRSDYSVGCWYNREGEESCSGDPGDYTPKSDANSGDGSGGNSDEFGVHLVDVSPREGVEDETLFTWVTTVGGTERPDVNLVIHNSSDGVDYEFPMETQSERSPWVFTYQKTLRDANSYNYWVVARSHGQEDSSVEHWVRAVSDWGEMPEFESEGISPSSGQAQNTEFRWRATVQDRNRPDISLMVVNPKDPTIYEFEMDVDDSGSDEWMGDFSKTLNDSTIYTFWFQARDGDSIQNSSVMSVEAR